jgi:hypothetical protein
MLYLIKIKFKFKFLKEYKHIPIYTINFLIFFGKMLKLLYFIIGNLYQL